MLQVTNHICSNALRIFVCLEKYFKHLLGLARTRGEHRIRIRTL